MLQKRKSVWENLSLVKGLGTGLTQSKKSYAEISDMLLPFQQWPQSVTGRLLFCHGIAIIRALERTPRLVTDTISVSRFFLPSFVMAVTLLIDTYLIILWWSFSSDMCQTDRCTLELCQVLPVSGSELPVSYPVVSSYWYPQVVAIIVHFTSLPRVVNSSEHYAET